MMDYSKGLKFKCQNCGYCCRFEPGFVFLQEEDLDRLCSYFKLSKNAFIDQYCREVYGPDGVILSLKEKKNHDCEFWDLGCTIYEARPSQCRTYPFWHSVMQSEESWKDESKYCPGINQDKLHSESAIADCLKEKAKPLYIKES